MPSGCLPTTPAGDNFAPRSPGAASFAVHWGRSGAVVSVVGEVDAANAADLVAYVRRCAPCGEWLVLDLTELQFMGTAGLSALQQINATCADVEVRWVVVPGSATSRLLRICNPGTALPLAESVAQALAMVQQAASLQLVPQSR